MSDYILSCSSTADLSAEHLAAAGIEYAYFHFMLDGKPYLDDLGKSVPYSDFYAAMTAGADTKTSQISVGEYVDHFTRLLGSGRDVLHVCFSSGLSSTFSSATTAAAMVRESFPERKLYVIDSLAASSGYGLLVDKLAALRDDGYTIDALRDWCEENKLRLNHWFFSTDLTFYIKGGRISKTAGFIGGMLGICPLLNMDGSGHLSAQEKIRTKKRVIRRIVDVMAEYADGGRNYDGKCYISQSACMEDAQSVAALVEAEFPHLDGKVLINNIGTTVGSHTGPGTVALFFWGSDQRK